MKILALCGLIDKKLFSKIEPLMKLKCVEKIYVVRRHRIKGDKIQCFSPPGILSGNIFTTEIYRVIISFLLCLTSKTDVLIGFGLILHGIYADLLGKLFRKKVIQLVLGKNDLLLTYSGKKIRKKILMQFLKRADFIGVRGENFRQMLIEKGVDREKIFIPHNVFDFNELQPVDKPKEYDLIYVGWLSYYKRVDVLLEVIAKVKDRYKGHIKTALIGDGPLRNDLEKQVEQLGIEGNVQFLGQRNLKEINDYLNRSKIFVMASQGEGLPMAMIEAMSCSLPCVMFDDADIATVAKNGYNALVVELHDVDAFADAIIRLLSDEELYAQLAKNALRIREDYAYEYSLENVMRIWKEVLEKCSLRSPTTSSYGGV